MDIIFLDFAKAFDKVSHIKLISKLKAHGINGKLWIKEWLHQRTQRVSIRGVSSDWINVLSGVPQRSVLGCVLFLIFINDLDIGIKSWILTFADDSKIFNRVNCTANVESLQMDLHTLITWSEEWQMLFDVSKCKVMHVGTMQFERQYLMNDQKLEVVTEENDLGMVISSDLKVSQKLYDPERLVLSQISLTPRSLTESVVASS